MQNTQTQSSISADAGSLYTPVYNNAIYILYIWYWKWSLHWQQQLHWAHSTTASAQLLQAWHWMQLLVLLTGHCIYISMLTVQICIYWKLRTVRKINTDSGLICTERRFVGYSSSGAGTSQILPGTILWGIKCINITAQVLCWIKVLLALCRCLAYRILLIIVVWLSELA